jgi:hypothetical protein
LDTRLLRPLKQGTAKDVPEGGPQIWHANGPRLLRPCAASGMTGLAPQQAAELARNLWARVPETIE